MPNYNDTVEVTRPWSDWLFLRQQRDTGGGGGFHIHNPWGNSTQPQGAADRNRLEIGYRTSTGQDRWGQLVIQGPTGNVGIGTVNPSDKLHVAGNVRANDFLVTSDARLKSDVSPIRGALKKLMKLRGVEFVWKDAGDRSTGEGARRSAGVIAQDVEAVAPELVDQRSEDAHKAVNLNGLIGFLIEALKEVSAENQALGLRIRALEQGNAAGSMVTTPEA
jgi:hypothetical protein